jgi:hypothetical protein
MKARRPQNSLDRVIASDAEGLKAEVLLLATLSKIEFEIIDDI